jgi:hypothetical protein
VTKRLNQDDKRARKAGQLTTFVQKYARKAQRNQDPNDRTYDRSVEAAIKRMPPAELDRLLRDDEEEA